MAEASTAVAVKQQSNALAVPDYLKGTEASGIESLGGQDFKIPRIMLLQPLSPAVKYFPGIAIPGHFWHTGLNVDLGDSLQFVPLLARKRVILWRPQDDNGGGMLAFSADGKTWQSGANTKYQVYLKGIKEPITWDTKSNVQASGLLEWGTANPNDVDSPPAATASYEYLMYLIGAPHLSPAVFSCNKTSLPRAKQFNTGLLMMAQAKHPIYCLNVKCNVVTQTEGRNSWFVPNFVIDGTVQKDVYEVTSKLSAQHANYVAEVSQEEAVATESDAF